METTKETNKPPAPIKMNIVNIQNRLLNGKWMMEKKSLYNLYDSVQRIGNLRVGGLRGLVFGDTPIVKMQEAIPRQTEAFGGEGDTAVVHISGILAKGVSEMEAELLGMQDIDDISTALDKIGNDPSVKNVLVSYSSPGGETCGIAELGRKIKALNSTVPVYTWTETNMASAAAWLGVHGRMVGMTPTSQVGSCGVYMIILDASEKYKEEGINPQVISSGEWKMLGHDFKPLTKEEKEYLQTDVNKQHEAFKAVVRANRPNIKDEALEGLSYEGEDALRLGWVDTVVDDVDDFLQEIANNK